MGVLTLDSFVRKNYGKAVRYYKPGQKLPGHFRCLGLDANPFVYAAVYRAFEIGPCSTPIPLNSHLSFDEKVKLVMDYTWDQIVEIVGMVDADEIYIAFDGVAPTAKMVQQRQRRYGRSLPSEGEFDLCNISTGTSFLHDLCTFIKHKIHEVQWPKTVVFSSHNVPGEGEHKIMDHFRKFKTGTKVCMFGPDGDLIMLGLSCSLDFHLLKMDHRTQFTDPKYYTIHINTVKRALSGGKFDTSKIDSFVFLGFVLGNDFVPRLEIFHLFFSGINDLYKYYDRMERSIIKRKSLDKAVFSRLLREMAKDEPDLLSKRTQHEYPLLEKHLHDGKLDFPAFRKEYYSEWMGLKTQEYIDKMACAYLDTLWWNWLYYTVGCPTFNHCYGYHYPPFVCDLVNVIDRWKIPHFTRSQTNDVPRSPFQQLCSVMPKNRIHLLPEKYHHIFKGPGFPDPSTIKINIEGRHPEYEAVYEVPIIREMNVDVKHSHTHKRNRLDTDRVLKPGSKKWDYCTKFGRFTTIIEG